jgi:hypothetical protein
VSTPEWLARGVEVIVTEGSAHGPEIHNVRVCRVEKIGKTHFTVEGVREGFSTRDDLPLVRFRVGGDPARGAADSRMSAYPADHPDALTKLARHRRREAESAVSFAFEAWRKARQEQVYSREHDGDRAATLFALADAVTALRGVYDAQGIVTDPAAGADDNVD